MSELHDETNSLLGHVFDQYQNMMQIARCVRAAAGQRSLSRPRILELSRYGTNLQEYLPEAILTRQPTHDEGEQPSLPMPVRVPFPDRAFDVCFVTDAYEHISTDQRPGLLREMIRVTDGLVLLGCPVHSELVTKADRLIFDFIWGKYAERFEPLRQHLEYGLEPLEEIVASLKAEGAARVAVLPDNYVYRWIHQILIFFDTQYANPQAGLYEAVNRIYNERIACYDYREPCYRYLLALSTDPQLDLERIEAELKGPCETPESLAEAEGVLIEAFRAAESKSADVLRECWHERDQLHRELEARQQENSRLRRELEESRQEQE